MIFKFSIRPPPGHHGQSWAEQVFSKLKHKPRKAAARSYEAVLAAIREPLGSYTPKECANYVKNCGYGAV